MFHFERHSLSMTFALRVFYSPPSITLESCFRRLMIRLLPLWFIVKTSHLEWEGEGVKTVNGNPSRHNPSKLFHLSLFPRWSVMVWYKCCAFLLPLIQWGCCHSKWGKERTEFFFKWSNRLEGLGIWTINPLVHRQPATEQHPEIALNADALNIVYLQCLK